MKAGGVMVVAWSINPKLIRNVAHRTEPSISTPAHVYPPALPAHITVDHGKLILSLARTHALTTASPLAFHALSSMASAVTELVDDGQTDLFVVADTDDFADAIKSALAGMAGAGIADVVMDQLGYGWRANAREAGLPPPPHGSHQIPDFVYDSGSQILPFKSLALVEAKGSLSQSTGTPGQTIAKAVSAFVAQVAPYLDPPGQQTATGLALDYGYAVAFSSIPGQSSTTVAVVEPDPPSTSAAHTGGQGLAVPASLRRTRAGARAAVQVPLASLAARHAGPAPWPAVRMMMSGGGAAPQPLPDPEAEPEEEPESWRGGGGGGRDGGLPPERFSEPARVSGLVAFLNYAAVFRAIGAYDAARALQAVAGGTAVPRTIGEGFLRLEVEGERFLVSRQALRSRWYDVVAPRPATMALLGIYERAARAILDHAKGSDTILPRHVDVPMVPEGLLARSFTETGLSVQRDGLALVPVSWPGLEMRSEPVHWDQGTGWLE